jgi:glycosyltransferase involved in cell wall biosynthesis
VLWAEKIFVIDSFSTDKTADIAKEYAPKVEVVQHKWEGYARQKNWALDNLRIPTDWVLFLDADEVATDGLEEAIEQAIASGKFDGYYIRSRYIFLGKWIKHAAGYPQWKFILFNRQKGRWEEREVHEHPIVQGKVGYLFADIIHHDRKPLWFFLDRHNKYSDLEAKERFERWYGGGKDRRLLKGRLFGKPAERRRFIKERIWRWIPFKPLAILIWFYIFRLGFLDGRAGLYFCLHKAVQEFYTDMKIYELRIHKSVPKTVSRGKHP